MRALIDQLSLVEGAAMLENLDRDALEALALMLPGPHSWIHACPDTLGLTLVSGSQASGNGLKA
jgi:hypothetical protein